MVGGDNEDVEAEGREDGGYGRRWGRGGHEVELGGGG